MSNCMRCGAVGRSPHQHICDECHEDASAKRWAKLPKVKWNGEGGIYSDTYDEYFYDEESAAEWLYDHDLNDWDALRLVICEPVHAKPLDPDQWSDDIPDDSDCPEWLLDAISEFNEKLEGQAPR
jgi:hypothetical protein